MNITCIGAHPDDVELGMGGAVLRMVKRGHNVSIIDLSNGESTPFGDVETRKIESSKAADALGVSRTTLTNKNRFIYDTIEARIELASVLRKTKPEVIFTHYEYDVHPDHIQVSSITDAARFYSKLTKSDIQGEPFFPKKIIYYFPNHVHLNIQPSFCIDISEEMDLKEKVLKFYESQFIKKGNGVVIEEIKQINRYFGIRIQKNYAEPFFLRDSLDLDFFKELI